MSEEFPTVTQQAKNLTKLLGKVAQQAIEGEQVLASDTDRTERLLICHSCEFYHRRTKRCKQCGCHIPAKIKLQASECPIKKW